MIKFYARIFLVLLLTASLASPKNANAQSALIAGDIAFTGYNATAYGNNFSFILLKPVSSGTQINFTDIGWNPITNALISTGTDGVFTWTSTSAIAQFTEITIAVTPGTGNGIVSVSSGSASTPTGGTGTGTGFVLSASGDQILAYQGAQAAPTFIAGIHCNSQTVPVGTSGVSTLAGWDDIQVGGIPYGANVSHIPPGLTTGVNAIMVVDASFLEYDTEKYNCTGSNTNSSAANLAAAINDRNNWIMSNTAAVTLPTGCSFSVAAPPSISVQPQNTTVCAGGNASFSVIASGATSYQWQENSGSSFVNITNTGIYSGTNSSTLTITGVTSGMNNYSYRVIVTGSSSVTSNSAVLTVTNPGTWLGTSSANWDVAGNWSCGTVPTATTNVVIPAGTPNSPAVSSAAPVANNISIAAGAVLTVTATGTIRIYGALNNTGTYTATAAGAKTVFAGTTQSIPALTYNALQVSGGSSKTISGNVTVSGIFTLTSGYVVLGSNNLTIASSGSITGSSINSYVVISGSGSLVQQNIGTGGRTGTIVFPLGTAAGGGSYTPLYLNNSSGTADAFSARIINNAYKSYDASDIPNGAQITSMAIGKTWFLKEAVAGGSNATLTLQFNSTDELSGFDETNCFVSHYIVGSGYVSSAQASAGGFDPFTISYSGLTSFSPFIVASAGAVLPLQLIAFTGRKQGINAELKWQTEFEQNVAGYDVERSTDGNTFQKAGFVNAKGNTQNSYDFSDPFMKEQIVRYRLKIIDLDGSFKYSSIISLRNGDQKLSLLVSPVPAHNVINIQNQNPDLNGKEASIYDPQGKIIKTIKIYPSAQVDISQWAPGTYFISVGSGGKVPIIKQ